MDHQCEENGRRFCHAIEHEHRLDGEVPGSGAIRRGDKNGKGAYAKDEESGEDYAGLDLLAEIGRMGIGTICLDEAHHLQNEWQKSLESFLAALKGQVKVIALTATPPYDAKPNEWERYIGVCGEIDEEIFVPELVQQLHCL